MKFSADTGELVALAADLGKVKGDSVKPVIAKSAASIQKLWRANAKASSGRHARQYPSFISFDIVDRGFGAEIGPTKRGQGNLGAILEYGSVHNPPHHDGKRAWQAEEPKLLAALGEAIGKELGA